MGQKVNVLFLLLLSVGAFLYFRYKDKDFSERIKVLFILGVVFVVSGSLIVFLIFDLETLVNCLTLHSHKVSGRLILIGYCFILMSALFLTDELLDRFFRIFTSKKPKK